MENIVHLVIGAIGTGKSSLSKVLAKKNNIEILSADDVENINKDIISDSDIDGEIVEHFFYFLDQNKSFILDGLNLTLSSRRFYINQAKRMGYKIYVYDLGPGDNNSLTRRLKDNRGVSAERWKEIAESNKINYEKPQKDTENIDKLYTLY